MYLSPWRNTGATGLPQGPKRGPRALTVDLGHGNPSYVRTKSAVNLPAAITLCTDRPTVPSSNDQTAHDYTARKIVRLEIGKIAVDCIRHGSLRKYGGPQWLPTAQ